MKIAEQQKITVDNVASLMDLLKAMIVSGYDKFNIEVKHKKFPHEYEKYFVVKFHDREEE